MFLLDMISPIALLGGAWIALSLVIAVISAIVSLLILLWKKM